MILDCRHSELEQCAFLGMKPTSHRKGGGFSEKISDFSHRKCPVKQWGWKTVQGPRDKPEWGGSTVREGAEVWGLLLWGWWNANFSVLCFRLCRKTWWHALCYLVSTWHKTAHTVSKIQGKLPLTPCISPTITAHFGSGVETLKWAQCRSWKKLFY
jgi:hypothetical protein